MVLEGESLTRSVQYIDIHVNRKYHILKHAYPKNVNLLKLVVVMAKEPTPGKVKTRMTPPLTPFQAAELYRCFLQDRLRAMERLEDLDIAVAYAPARARPFFEDFCRGRIELLAQEGKDLGEKMHRIFQKKLPQGYAAVAVTGSDSPDLPNRLILESFDWLLQKDADLVLGPCPDGGYYLIALKKPYPELFRKIPWSTGRVLAATLEEARRLGLATGMLSPWNDLDRVEDLIAFRQNYRKRKTDADRIGAATYSFCNNLAI